MDLRMPMFFGVVVYGVLLTRLGSESALADDLSTEMMRATVKISHESSTATGFVLWRSDEKRPVLVTAAHVLETIPSDEAELIFREISRGGDYSRLPLKIAIRKEGQPLWIKHPSEDVAVLAVSPPPNADLPQVPTSLLANDDQLRQQEVHPGTNLAYLGYPHREESHPAGFPLLRDGPIASFPLLPTAKTRTFMLSANTFEGDSGGPVYLAKDDAAPLSGLLVGLVSAQRFLDEEATLLYGTTKLRHRLGFAIVIHASVIQETIDLLRE